MDDADLSSGPVFGDRREQGRWVAPLARFESAGSLYLGHRGPLPDPGGAWGLVLDQLRGVRLYTAALLIQRLGAARWSCELRQDSLRLVRPDDRPEEVLLFGAELDSATCADLDCGRSIRCWWYRGQVTPPAPAGATALTFSELTATAPDGAC